MAAPTLDSARPLGSATAGHDRFARRRVEARIGSAASVALVLCLLALGANAAAGRSNYVPSGAHRFPAWLAGPLAPLGFTTAHAVLEGLVIAICVCYALVLACLRSLQPRHVWAAVVAATIAALLAPPLLSTAVFPYLGWRTVTTPYGPAFTLLSYALVPLGLAAGLWAFKLLAAATTLATVVLIWRIAERLGRSPRWAIAMYGLNPLVLVFAVGGAHNDTLFEVLLAAAALSMISARERAAAVGVIGAIAVKVSAGMMLPYAWIGARRRRAFAGEALAGAIVFGVISFAVFGTHLSGIEHALAAEQHQVARHGVPAELSGLLGLGRPDAQGVRLAEGIRVAFIVAFAAALAATLWRAWRGAWWLDCYGWATLALLACSAWLLPWYGMWALLPASVSASRRLQGVTLAACAYLVAIKIL